MRRTGVTTPAVAAEVESSANFGRSATHQKSPTGAAFGGLRSLGMDPKPRASHVIRFWTIR